MSTSDLLLATTYLQKYPDSAVSVLESLSAADVADLLRQLPIELATAALSRMVPINAARTIIGLNDAKLAAAILAGMKVSQSTAVLRFLRPTQKEPILTALPLELAAACRLGLSYSRNTVGAWMIPQPIMLPSDCTVAQALKQLSDRNIPMTADAVFVVDRDLIPQGVVDMPTLLQTAGNTPLTQLMDRQTFAVSGSASILSVQEHHGWGYRDSLPVVNRQRQLIGMLRHVDMRRGLARQFGQTTVMRAEDVQSVGEIYKTYGNVLMALLNVFGDVTKNK